MLVIGRDHFHASEPEFSRLSGISAVFLNKAIW
jgi:hypothetical protein